MLLHGTASYVHWDVPGQAPLVHKLVRGAHTSVGFHAISPFYPGNSTLVIEQRMESSVLHGNNTRSPYAQHEFTQIVDSNT